MTLQSYTVLILRPDNQWDGSPSDWVYRAHVQATSVASAEAVAKIQAAAPEDDADDFAVLAVYAGLLDDLAS